MSKKMADILSLSLNVLKQKQLNEYLFIISPLSRSYDIFTG